MLDEHPTPLDTRVLFPETRGGRLGALTVASPPRVEPGATGDRPRAHTEYALRHTYASLSIAAGVSLFELSRARGALPAMLDNTYGHVLRRVGGTRQ
ncbi:MAG: hypothetical protein ACR2G9_05105 [Gaiellaceae bacterium]